MGMQSLAVVRNHLAVDADCPGSRARTFHSVVRPQYMDTLGRSSIFSVAILATARRSQLSFSKAPCRRRAAGSDAAAAAFVWSGWARWLTSSASSAGSAACYAGSGGASSGGASCGDSGSRPRRRRQQPQQPQQRRLLMQPPEPARAGKTITLDEGQGLSNKGLQSLITIRLHMCVSKRHLPLAKNKKWTLRFSQFSSFDKTQGLCDFQTSHAA